MSSNYDHHHHDHHSKDHHDHHHHHSLSVTTHNQRKVLLCFWLISIFMLVEVAAGIISGSLALIADAGHMFTDAIALALAYLGFRLGKKAPDEKRTFGYLRLEVLAAFVNAIFMLFIVLWIAFEVFRRWNAPVEIHPIPMLIAATIGLIVNLVVFWILTRGDTQHVNIKGAILHVIGDLLGSIGACIAAILIYFTGWLPIDLVLSLVVALMIVPSAWRLLKESAHILLEGAPPDIDGKDVMRHLETLSEGKVTVTQIHMWMLSSHYKMVSVRIRFSDIHRQVEVCNAVEHALKEHFHFQHVAVAMDWATEKGGSDFSRADTILDVKHEH